MTATTLEPSLPTPTRHRVSPLAGVRHGLTIGWRNLVRVKNAPEQLIGFVLQPILFIALFVFLFGGAISGDWRTYLQFVLPGILVQTVVFASMGTGASLADDITKGVFDRFRSLPIARWAPLLGAVLADLATYVVSVLVVLVAGLVLGFDFTGGPLGVLAGCLLVLAFTFALSWVTATVGLLVRKPSGVQALAIVVMMPLTFGSNLFADPSSMPGWLQAWVEVNPVSHLITATRGLFAGDPAAGATVAAVAWAVGIVVVFAPLAVWLYRRRA
ncbi:MAG: ABC transporter permease [Streptosporangiales bacterium]|nr:ABC transporter permease [Streptosporangiales bacterium]